MGDKKALLSVRGLEVSYGAIKALHGVDIDVFQGEIVSVIGANGAGKSTLMNAIMGDIPRQGGSVYLGDKELQARNYKVVSQGLSLSPEGRRVFTTLTVHENLMMGAFPRRKKDEIRHTMDHVYDLFPRLKERENQYAGTLSGGEQQMLAIGRALMSAPKVLLLDEPSLGLAPIVIRDIFKELSRINQEGMTILLVEQNAKQALMLSHRAYVIQTGRVIMEGLSKDLLANPEVEAAYLGAGRKGD